VHNQHTSFLFCFDERLISGSALLEVDEDWAQPQGQETPLLQTLAGQMPPLKPQTAAKLHCLEETYQNPSRKLLRCQQRLPVR